MIQFFVNNWSIIIALLTVVSWGVCTVLNFAKLPKEVQINNIKEWLKYAVTEAEKQFGQGTGNLKLRQVYGAFVTQFPNLALIITFEQFSSWVDEALIWMKEQIDKNKNIDVYIKGEQTE